MQDIVFIRKSSLRHKSTQSTDEAYGQQVKVFAVGALYAENTKSRRLPLILFSTPGRRINLACRNAGNTRYLQVKGVACHVKTVTDLLFSKGYFL